MTQLDAGWPTSTTSTSTAAKSRRCGSWTFGRCSRR